MLDPLKDTPPWFERVRKSEPIHGHFCDGTKLKLIIKYPSLLCSRCRGNSMEVEMSEEDIDAYNKTLEEAFSEKGA